MDLHGRGTKKVPVSREDTGTFREALAGHATNRSALRSADVRAVHNADARGAKHRRLAAQEQEVEVPDDVRQVDLGVAVRVEQREVGRARIDGGPITTLPRQ